MNSRIELLTVSDDRFSDSVEWLWGQQQWQPHSHTQSALRYYAQRPQDDGFLMQDASFVLHYCGEPAAAFLGALISNGAVTDLKAYEIPAICLVKRNPISSEITERLVIEVSRLIEQVRGIVFVRDFLQDGMFSPIVLFLLRQGAALRTDTYQLVDLMADEASLWRGLRKSYKSLINGAGKMLRIELMDASNADWARMNAFRELHVRVAGRETRSVNSWRRQFEWILDGSAYLVCGWRDDELVSAGMFTFSSSMCTYFSSASRRDMFDKPMFHALMWEGMMHAKSLGCRWFDVNEKYFQNNPIQGYEDQQMMSISDFKLGFGGSLKPVVDIELRRNLPAEIS